MFNCYAINLNGKLFAVFKTEQACENFIYIMNERTSQPYEFTVNGMYSADFAF